MAAEQAAYHERIITDPDVLVGKPVVRGTRISVELVLQRLSENLDLDELFADYPRLTLDDVKACLAYAKTIVGKQKLKKPTRAPRGLPQAV